MQKAILFFYFSQNKKLHKIKKKFFWIVRNKSVTIDDMRCLKTKSNFNYEFFLNKIHKSYEIKFSLSLFSVKSYTVFARIIENCFTLFNCLNLCLWYEDRMAVILLTLYYCSLYDI